MSSRKEAVKKYLGINSHPRALQEGGTLLHLQIKDKQKQKKTFILV